MSESLIDIRDFKGLTRYQFIDNTFKRIEKKLDGVELEFYELDEEIVNKLKSIESQKMSNEEYLYTIIPMVCNVDMTLDLEKFTKMCLYPSVQFVEFISCVIDFCKDLGEKLRAINNLNRKTKAINFENLVRVDGNE